MQLEDYFDFQAPDDIRLKGHRIGIETILFNYLDGLTPEEIAVQYPTLNLEKIYATITYYWHKKAEIDAYLHDIEAYSAAARREQELNPSPAVKRLREMLEARRAAVEAGRIPS